MLLHTTSDDEKMEIELHLNENIKWHCMQPKLNLDLIYFNLNSIEFKFNSIPIEFDWDLVNSIPVKLDWDLVEFNSNSIEFRFDWIQLKINKMQIGARRYWNLLVIFIVCDYGVRKKEKLRKDADLKKKHIPLYSKKIQNQNLFRHDKTYWP
jgi:hypothetical protein